MTRAYPMSANDPKRTFAGQTIAGACGRHFHWSRRHRQANGGSIDVNTQSGEFTEFRIVLPRTVATIAKSAGQA